MAERLAVCSLAHCRPAQSAQDRMIRSASIEPPFDNPLIVPFEQTMDVTDLLRTGPELVVLGETIERVLRQ